MDLEGQLRLSEQPDQRVVMRQRWEELLFLHWEMNPELIQATLPSGLEVDTFEGKAYLGLVPFFMRGVRPSFLPAVPWLSDFMECNLRTYVTGPEGPGVWFYSLDCNQPLAVEFARSFFHLSYFHAQMSAERQAAGWIEYETRRLYKSSLRHMEKASHYRYRGQRQESGEVKTGKVDFGTLDFFLLERYLLYSANFKNNSLFYGRVWHKPYPVGAAEVDIMEDQLVEVAGFNPLERPPKHVHYSPGVDVRIYGLKRC